MSSSTRHRSGWQKQKNKTHKQVHSSKREIQKQFHGRVGSVNESTTSNHKIGVNARLGREDRANRAALVRKNKRNALLSQRRAIGSIGVKDSAPKIVGIVLLHENGQVPHVLGSTLRESLQSFKPFNVNLKKEKTGLTFLVAARNPLSVLDIAKVADILCFVLPVGINDGSVETKGANAMENFLGDAIDEKGRLFITLAKAQGIPQVIGLVQNLNTVPTKRQQAVKKHATNFFTDEFGSSTKVIVDEADSSMVTDNQIDFSNPEASVSTLSNQASQFLRAIKDVRTKSITWRNERSYLLANAAEMVETSTLKVSGYLRGKPLNVHQLIHIPGHGNFQMKKIESAVDVQMGKQGEVTVLAHANPEKVATLEEEAAPDLLAGDQTWPTEEEMHEATEIAMKPRKKRVPKGTSEYQAAWIPSDDSSAEEGSDNDDEDLEGGDKDDDDEFEDLEETNESKLPQISLEEWKRQRKETEKEELDFPDEVNTPTDIAAKERFVKYRGLKSFRTSPWHPKEQLPREYARIYQIENPGAIQKEVLEEGALMEQNFLAGMTEDSMGSEEYEGFVFPGQYVSIYLDNVPSNLLESLSKEDMPLIMGALLEHEQKLTVLNCTVQRAQAYEDPVKSRDEVLVSCGIWRRLVRPIYSENSTNSDKHKFERFLLPSRWTVASMYAPLTFGTNVPVLCFNPTSYELMANGSLLNADPDRIVLKRVVLSGYPIRTKKSWAVVRYMFYSPEDVRWFKPVDLWTKFGIAGRIIEPVGTHGLFKCTFERHIKQNDTVCMSLYKRVFPKPTTEFKDLHEDADKMQE